LTSECQNFQNLDDKCKLIWIFQYSWQHTLINAEHNLHAEPGSAFSLMVC
jgi:hypothetical protein